MKHKQHSQLKVANRDVAIRTFTACGAICCGWWWCFLKRHLPFVSVDPDLMGQLGKRWPVRLTYYVCFFRGLQTHNTVQHYCSVLFCSIKKAWNWKVWKLIQTYLVGAWGEDNGVHVSPRYPFLFFYFRYIPSRRTWQKQKAITVCYTKNSMFGRIQNYYLSKKLT